MGLLNRNDFITTERAGQLLFKDNGNFRFRHIVLDDASLVEKKDGVDIKGWRHTHKLEFPFYGYGDIPEGDYTLSHERDILWDPFNILDDNEKPSTDTSKGIFNRRGITEIAANTCYRHEVQPPTQGIMDKITWALVILALLFGMAVFIRLI